MKLKSNRNQYRLCKYFTMKSICATKSTQNNTHREAKMTEKSQLIWHYKLTLLWSGLIHTMRLQRVACNRGVFLQVKN